MEGLKTYVFSSYDNNEVVIEVKNCIDKQVAMSRLSIMIHTAGNMGIHLPDPLEYELLRVK